MEEAKAALRKAAQLIEEHGHIKGGYGNTAVGFCAAGALWCAIVGRPRLGGDSTTTKERDTYREALGLMPTGIGGLAAWNDSERTTKDDVIRTLREAAA